MHITTIVSTRMKAQVTYTYWRCRISSLKTEIKRRNDKIDKLIFNLNYNLKMITLILNNLILPWLFIKLISNNK